MLYIIEDSYAAPIPSGTEDSKTYCDNFIPALMPGMVGRVVLNKFESVSFEIYQRRTNNDVSSTIQYLVKVTEVLLKAD